MKVINQLHCPADYDCRNCKNFDTSSKYLMRCKIGVYNVSLMDNNYVPIWRDHENFIRNAYGESDNYCDKYEANEGNR